MSFCMLGPCACDESRPRTAVRFCGRVHCNDSWASRVNGDGGDGFEGRLVSSGYPQPEKSDDNSSAIGTRISRDVFRNNASPFEVCGCLERPGGEILLVLKEVL